MPRLPCDVLSIDAQDVMGSHDVDISGNLWKQPLDEGLQAVGEKEEMKASNPGTGSLSSGYNSFYGFGGGDYRYQDEQSRKVKEKLAKKEGCRVWGFVRVNRVPGNV